MRQGQIESPEWLRLGHRVTVGPVSTPDAGTALRRVATLVAAGAGPAEVFSAVAEAEQRLRELADTQASLRRLAMLVARGE